MHKHVAWRGMHEESAAEVKLLVGAGASCRAISMRGCWQCTAPKSKGLKYKDFKHASAPFLSSPAGAYLTLDFPLQMSQIFALSWPHFPQASRRHHHCHHHT